MKRVITLAVLVLSLTSCRSPIDESANYQQVTRVFQILPSQTLVISNTASRAFEIQSQYPVDLISGPCREPYTVQADCNLSEPHDIVLRDLRNRPIFTTPQSSSIRITFTVQQGYSLNFTPQPPPIQSAAPASAPPNNPPSDAEPQDAQPTENTPETLTPEQRKELGGYTQN